MSCLILHWKFQFLYSALNLMFLLDFSLHFFKVNASTKLDFLNAQYLTLVGGWGEKEYNQMPTCIFFIWVFLALDFPCDPLCMCCRRLVLRLHPYAPLPFPFMSRSTFVISQLEQHDLELFKAACTFCIKNMKKKEKKAKRQKVI